MNNDFEALKFSGVAAVLLAAFFSYHWVFNKERLTAADRPTKFILVLGKISPFWQYPSSSNQLERATSINRVKFHIFTGFYVPVHSSSSIYSQYP